MKAKTYLLEHEKIDIYKVGLKRCPLTWIDVAMIMKAFSDAVQTEYQAEGVTLIKVCYSGAGYYLGRMCDSGPYSRESKYFKKRDEAQDALNKGNYFRKL